MPLSKTYKYKPEACLKARLLHIFHRTIIGVSPLSDHGSEHERHEKHERTRGKLSDRSAPLISADACFSLKITTSAVEGQVDNIILKNKDNKNDKALALLATSHVEFDPNSPKAKAVLRKIDYRVMPILLIVYVLMLVDKNSISYANIMGIKADVGLSASQFSWLGSIV